MSFLSTHHSESVSDSQGKPGSLQGLMCPNVIGPLSLALLPLFTDCSHTGLLCVP